MRAYLLVLEITQMEVGKIYSSLPLHCTIVNWFRCTSNPKQLSVVIKEIMKKSSHIELFSESPDLFGAKNTIPVFTVRKTNELETLHVELFHALKKFSPQYTEAAFANDGYRPHVTTQDTESFPVGSHAIIKNAYFIEALDSERITNKKVLEKIALG